MSNCVHQHVPMLMVVVVYYICGIVLLVHPANADEMLQIKYCEMTM